MKKKKRKMRTGRGGKRNQRIRRNRRLIVLAGIVTAAALVYFTVIIVGLIKNLHSRSSLSESGPYVKATKLANETPQNVSKELNVNPDIINHIIGAGRRVSEALSQRPETVELTPENTAEFASINNCAIVDGEKIQIEATSF